MLSVMKKDSIYEARYEVRLPVSSALVTMAIGGAGRLTYPKTAWNRLLVHVFPGPRSRGTKYDQRLVVSGIAWKLMMKIPWKKTPDCYPLEQSCRAIMRDGKAMERGVVLSQLTRLRRETLLAKCC